MVAQDPRFGGGSRSLTEAFWSGAVALGRRPELHYVSLAEGLSPRLRLRLRPRRERHGDLRGVAYPAALPELEPVSRAVGALAIGRRLRGEPSLWVVGASAPHGLAARAAGRPYACWLATGLEAEWAARRPSLPRTRRLGLAISRPGLRAFERQVLRGARLVYATSPASRGSLAEAGRLPLEAIEILPVPVDLERFAPGPDRDWESTLERPTILFVGRAADPRKNVAALLEAFRLLRARLPAARLRLVGEPPGLALPEGAEAVGPVPDVAAELARATVLVLPSLQEGFGIVVAEALAAGVPVVVTPCGGPEELVRGSGGGVVAEGFGAEAVAAALSELLQDPGRLLAARRSGRRHVEREHSSARFRDLLARALARLDAEVA